MQALFDSRERSERADAAVLHIGERLDSAATSSDEMYRLEVFGQQISNGVADRIIGKEADKRRDVDHSSKGFKRGLIKKRIFLAVFIVGAFKACFPQDTNRCALLLQAASGTGVLGIIDQPEPNCLTKKEVKADLQRFTLEVFEQGSVLLSDLAGFLATCENDPQAFGRGMKPLYDLYHEIYLECFGQNYDAILDDGKSLRYEFHKHVIDNVQLCIEMMQQVGKELSEI